jgi:hypothetical protein
MRVKGTSASCWPSRRRNRFICLYSVTLINHRGRLCSAPGAMVVRVCCGEASRDCPSSQLRSPKRQNAASSFGKNVQYCTALFLFRVATGRSVASEDIGMLLYCKALTESCWALCRHEFSRREIQSEARKSTATKHCRFCSPLRPLLTLQGNALLTR